MEREQLAQKIQFLTDNKCEQCGELWNSEFHASDQCINLNEDRDEDIN